MAWSRTTVSGQPLSVRALAELTGAELAGEGSGMIVGPAGSTDPSPDRVTFVEKIVAPESLAGFGAVLAPGTPAVAGLAVPVLRVANPRLAFARVLEHFYPVTVPEPGVDRTAAVSPTATVAATAIIGAHAVVGASARIGARTVVGPGTVIGDEATVGDDTVLFANVVVYPGCRLGNRVRIHAGTVIGSDGFGYVWDRERHYKMPQVGEVIIEDDVELGANVTVDRGTLGPTVIRRGAKIDNLVQIAHNVEIGENAILVSQVGVSGSAQVGAGAVLGGQVGVAGHLRIGAGATVAAKSGVTKNVPPGQLMSGFPLRPHAEEKRIKAAQARLPELLRRVAHLEKELAANKEKGS